MIKEIEIKYNESTDYYLVKFKFGGFKMLGIAETMYEADEIKKFLELINHKFRLK